MGNLRSVEKALAKVGATVTVSRDRRDVERADKLVLPGVGAFGAAMRNLETADLTEAIISFIASGRPFLGICLGLQLLFEESEEMGRHKGLQILPGKVARLPEAPGCRVPHIGWNSLSIVNRPPHLEGISEGDAVYFVHSYHVVPEDDSIVATRTQHGILFVSAVWKENIFAVQFHPEKSSSVGLRLLQNFARLGEEL
jgi:glutamine amidotransferase